MISDFSHCPRHRYRDLSSTQLEGLVYNIGFHRNQRHSYKTTEFHIVGKVGAPQASTEMKIKVQKLEFHILRGLSTHLRVSMEIKTYTQKPEFHIVGGLGTHLKFPWKSYNYALKYRPWIRNMNQVQEIHPIANTLQKKITKSRVSNKVSSTIMGP